MEEYGLRDDPTQSDYGMDGDYGEETEDEEVDDEDFGSNVIPTLSTKNSMIIAKPGDNVELQCSIKNLGKSSSTLLVLFFTFNDFRTIRKSLEQRQPDSVPGGGGNECWQHHAAS